MRLFLYWFVVGFLVIAPSVRGASADDHDKSAFWNAIRLVGGRVLAVKVQDHGRMIYYVTPISNSAELLSRVKKTSRQYSTVIALRAEFESESEGYDMELSIGDDRRVFNDSDEQGVYVLNFTKDEIATLYRVTIDKVTDRALHGIRIDESTDRNVIPMSSESDIKKNRYLLLALLAGCSGGLLGYLFGTRRRLAQKKRMKDLS